MARRGRESEPTGQPEELKPVTLLDIVSRFNRQGMELVGVMTRDPFHQAGHQAMLSLAAREFLGNVTAPHTFMLKPEEQRALEAHLKESVGITEANLGVSVKSGFLKTEKDSERLLVAANYVNELAGTEPKVRPDKNK